MLLASARMIGLSSPHLLDQCAASPDLVVPDALLGQDDQRGDDAVDSLTDAAAQP